MNKNTRNMKHAILLFAITTSALAGDFRNSSWGDSRETVIANEGIDINSIINRPSRYRVAKEGPMQRRRLAGGSVEIASWMATPWFEFTYDQLTGASYTIDSILSNAFLEMVTILMRKYGQPNWMTDNSAEWLTEETRIYLVKFDDNGMSLSYESIRLQSLVDAKKAEEKAAEEAEIEKALDLL